MLLPRDRVQAVSQRHPVSISRFFAERATAFATEREPGRSGIGTYSGDRAYRRRARSPHLLICEARANGWGALLRSCALAVGRRVMVAF